MVWLWYCMPNCFFLLNWKLLPSLSFEKIVASGCERTGLFYFTLQIPVYKSAVVWEGSKFRHIVMDSKLAPFSCHLSFLPNSACYHEVGTVLCKRNRKINPPSLYVLIVSKNGHFLNPSTYSVLWLRNIWMVSFGIHNFSFKEKLWCFFTHLGTR